MVHLWQHCQSYGSLLSHYYRPKACQINVSTQWFSHSKWKVSYGFISSWNTFHWTKCFDDARVSTAYICSCTIPIILCTNVTCSPLEFMYRLEFVLSVGFFWLEKWQNQRAPTLENREGVWQFQKLKKSISRVVNIAVWGDTSLSTVNEMCDQVMYGLWIF